MFNAIEKIKHKKKKVKEYSDSLYSIPNVNYFPTTELAKIKSPKRNTNIDANDDNNTNNNEDAYTYNNEEEDNRIEELKNMEIGFKEALKAARKGDTTALYNFNMKSALEEQSSLIQSISR